MKRIKPYVFAVLVIMTVMCLSACGSNKNTTNETTGGSSAAATQTSAMESSSAAESSSTDMGNTRNACLLYTSSVHRSGFYKHG